jgi:carotenoid cleavage dioxygenase
VPANTHVVRHADKILALVESGLPYEMTPELDTVGPCDFGGRLTTAMTAHPKEDPLTGELHFFGYGFIPPFLTYHRLSKEGDLVESREVPVPGPTMMHDFAITRHHVVWLDLPVVFDMARVGKGLPFRWDDAYGARIGIMPRQDGASQVSSVESAGGADSAGDPNDIAGMVRWFEIDPSYVFHVGNACEDERGRIVIDAVRYAPNVFTGMWDIMSGSTNPAAEAGGARLHRWVLDPATGAVKEETLDELEVEFPTIDDRRTGHTNDHLYAVTNGGIVKYDLRSGRSRIHSTAARPDEAIFVPRGSAGDDDGWLLSIVGSQAELLVLDAADMTRVATVRLPRRVPAGFHGSWIADEPQ